MNVTLTVMAMDTTSGIRAVGVADFVVDAAFGDGAYGSGTYGDLNLSAGKT